jgi:hypothetical protein
MAIGSVGWVGRGSLVFGNRLRVAEGPDYEVVVDDAILRRLPRFMASVAMMSRRRPLVFLVDQGDGVGREELAFDAGAFEPIPMHSVASPGATSPRESRVCLGARTYT